MARHFESGDVITMQGATNRKTIVVQSGLVKTSLTSPDGDEAILWIYGPGAVLGLANETCAITAMQPTVIRECVLTPADVRKITELRLMHAEQRLLSIMTRLTSARLAEVLLRISDEIKSPTIHSSREELGQLIGATLFTVSRVLSTWERKGLVLVSRGTVAVLDRKLLSEADGPVQRTVSLKHLVEEFATQ